MDEFKKHLKLHEAELDTEKPGAHVWEQVKQKTEKQSSRIFPISNWMKYAAAAILLLLIGLTIKYSISGTKNKQPEVIATQTDSLPDQVIDTIAASPVPVIHAEKIKKAEDKKIAQLPQKKKVPELTMVNELENNYGQLVNYQLDRIRQTPVYAEEPGYFDSFKNQLRQIEKDETAVKKDIAQNGLSDILLDQLIEVYQQKLTVLKSFQTAIQKMNNRVQLQQKDSTASKHYYITL